MNLTCHVQLFDHSVVSKMKIIKEATATAETTTAETTTAETTTAETTTAETTTASIKYT